jgi:hypothetical protein
MVNAITMQITPKTIPPTAIPYTALVVNVTFWFDVELAGLGTSDGAKVGFKERFIVGGVVGLAVGNSEQNCNELSL